MGSMPRLKIKDEIRYREGSTNEAENCVWCKRFELAEPDALVRSSAYGTCGLIGRQSTVRYRVRGDHRCDRHEYDEAKTPGWMRRKREQGEK